MARAPAVMVLARSVERAKLPPKILKAINDGHMAVVSRAQNTTRLTQAMAADRNDLAASLAKHIVIASASEGGELERKVRVWGSLGKSIRRLDHPNA